ncbi:MAG: hypothetical protein RBQ97_01700 [Acholeplasma sp.]|nr:hypothetical protein [Acholeplasma sp.]
MKITRVLIIMLLLLALVPFSITYAYWIKEISNANSEDDILGNTGNWKDYKKISTYQYEGVRYRNVQASFDFTMAMTEDNRLVGWGITI